MQFSYDPRDNIAYIRFHEQQTEVESIKVGDELVVDMTPDGKLFGIELLNATEQPLLLNAIEAAIGDHFTLVVTGDFLHIEVT